MIRKTSKLKGNNKKTQFAFYVSSIELIKSIVSDEKLSKNDNSFLSFKLEAKVHIDEEKSKVGIVIVYILNEDQKEFINISVKSEFLVRDLNPFIVNGQLVRDKLHTLMFMSICHARGYHSSLLKATSFSSYFIPHTSISKILDAEMEHTNAD